MSRASRQSRGAQQRSQHPTAARSVLSIEVADPQAEPMTSEQYDRAVHAFAALLYDWNDAQMDATQANRQAA